MKKSIKSLFTESSNLPCPASCEGPNGVIYGSSQMCKVCKGKGTVTKPQHDKYMKKQSQK